MTSHSSPLDHGTGSVAALPATDLPSASALWRRLTPICLVVFTEFLAMGLPLSILPVQVDEVLGFSSFMVGLVIGAQSIATLLTRHWAGTRADLTGPKSATTLGLVLSGLAGVVCAVSVGVSAPYGALTLLLFGRLLLGVGESLVVTGALSWGVALAGRERMGVVMSWVGVAMYGAMALGAPIGSILANYFGFAGMALAAAMAPLSGLGALAFAQSVAATGGPRLAFHRVIGLLWLPGLGLASSALGFGAIAGFSALRFSELGWSQGAMAMSAFGATYILTRLIFGSLPDRFGGARVAMGSAVVAALGQFGMWGATSPAMAIAASAVTGVGFSLAFPAFGIEAMRRVPPQNRGVALGAYSACFDMTLGLGLPLLGIASGSLGYGAAFGISGFAALGSAIIAGSLHAVSRKTGATASTP